MTDLASSAWRNAYFSALFETDPARMPLKIAEARAAIAERLNNPTEIAKLEREAIEAAQQKLTTLKVVRVDVVELPVTTGDTPLFDLPL
jgi:hypothetical protein